MGQKSSVLPISDETIPPAGVGVVGAGGAHSNGGPNIGPGRILTSYSNGSNSQDVPKDEYPHFGTVSVQLSWLTANVRYTPEQQSDITVTGKGAIFFGSNTSSPEIMSDLHRSKLFPREISLLDSRAHQLLVTYSNGWHAISSPEIFSRHSGTCIIIGDRQNPGPPYKIQLGDCFRLGSVGVVVSEIKTDKGIERKLDNKRLQYLREEALAFETDQDEAALAAEEEEVFSKKKQKSSTSLPPPIDASRQSSQIPNSNDENTSYNFQEGSSPFFCYMCYETHDTPDDHLVAPCECKGDTRYLHVQCLQKWYQSSVCGSQAHVIRTTSNGAPACKICGAAYKTAFRNNGVKTSLLEVIYPGPYISLVVVTRHDTSPGLFNTKFRLNFGPGYRVGGLPNQLQDDPDLTPSELTIGRSSLCNMVLDYRTVSTVHAKLTYRHGQFFVQDSRSSNGTMIYLQGPLPLPNNEVLRLRMGRSTLSIRAKRSITASFRGALQRLPSSTLCTASLSRLQEIMALAPVPKSARQPEKIDAEEKSPPIVVGPNNIEELNNVANQSSSPNRREDIDNALILGLERKDGGSSRENLDASGNLRSNTWNDPIPITLPRARNSSGNLAVTSSSTSQPVVTSPRESPKTSPKNSNNNQHHQTSSGTGHSPPPQHSTNLRQFEVIPSIAHQDHSDDQSISNNSGGGDSLSMVAVHHTTNPLSAISPKPIMIQVTPIGEEDESFMDEQSDQAVVAPIHHHLSRTIVNDIMSNIIITK